MSCSAGSRQGLLWVLAAFHLEISWLCLFCRGTGTETETLQERFLPSGFQSFFLLIQRYGYFVWIISCSFYLNWALRRSIIFPISGSDVPITDVGFIFFWPVTNSDQIAGLFPELTRAQHGLTSSLELGGWRKHHKCSLFKLNMQSPFCRDWGRCL